MRDKIHISGANGQDLICEPVSFTMHLMGVNTRDDVTARFAVRLNNACDLVKDCPKERGRAPWIARKFIPPLASWSVKRWLTGHAIPGQANLIHLANLLDVNADWLQRGPGNEVVLATHDEFFRQLAPMLPYLDEATKRKILDFAEVTVAPIRASSAPLPDEDEPKKLTLELPPFRDPTPE